jgi:hypothetical protein
MLNVWYFILFFLLLYNFTLDNSGHISNMRGWTENSWIYTCFLNVFLYQDIKVGLENLVFRRLAGENCRNYGFPVIRSFSAELHHFGMLEDKLGKLL